MIDIHMMILGILAGVVLSIVFTVVVRWYFYRKFKAGGIKKGDIVTNQTDGTKTTVFNENKGKINVTGWKSKVIKTPKLSASINKTIKLPETFSKKEMAFIDNWYSEKGMQHLLKAKGRNCEILTEKPPVIGCKYINAFDVPIQHSIRDTRTLQPIYYIKPTTIKLLLLNEWIK